MATAKNQKGKNKDDVFIPNIYPSDTGTLVTVMTPDNYYWPDTPDNLPGVPPDISPTELSQVDSTDFCHQVLMIYDTTKANPSLPLTFHLPYTLPGNDPHYLTVFTVVNKQYKPGKRKRSAVQLSQITTRDKDKDKKHAKGLKPAEKE